MKGAAAISVEICAVTEISSAGGDGGERDPARRIAPGREPAWVLRLRRRSRRLARRAQHQHAAPCDQRDQHEKERGPGPALLAERGQRLDDERIGDQRQEAADIARRIEKVRDWRRPDDRCARTTPAAAARWPRARRTAARSRPRTGRAARARRSHRPAGGPTTAAIDSGRNAIATTITTRCTMMERRPGRYFVSACA